MASLSHRPYSPTRPLSILLLSFTLLLSLIGPTLALSSPPAPPPPSHHKLTSRPVQRWRAELPPSGIRRALADSDTDDYDCRPYGNCEACPKDQRSEPFCQPYGNRRLLHCVPKGHSHHPDHPPNTSPSHAHSDPAHEENPAFETHEKEIPAWEACGKVVVKERNDYWEFVTINMLFFLVSMVILLLRTRKLAGMQYRMLAARIGLPGSGGSGASQGRFLGFSL